MHIALIGYGKMGKTIDRLAIGLGHTIAHRISGTNREGIHHLSGSDVAIEFTAPEAALHNYEAILQQGIPLVTGTTGWYDEMSTVQSLVEKHRGVMVHAANFSIGVHIAMKAAQLIARLALGQGGYSAVIDEWHHTEKKDAPSGTAIRFRETMEAEWNKSSVSVHAVGSDMPDRNIPIHSYREDAIPGTHRIKFTGTCDEISLEHKAFSRDGFAEGAIAAAAFAVQAPPGIYTLDHVLKTTL